MSLGNRLRHLHVPALGESDISAQLRRFRDSLKLSRRDQGRILGAGRLAGHYDGCNKTQINDYPRSDRGSRLNTHFDFLLEMN